MRLDGKIAIVTGGAGGIGAAITRAFVAEGARVLCADLVDALPGELAALGEQVAFLSVDLRAADAAARIRAVALDRFGTVHVLVNNAHASVQAPLLEHTQEAFDLSFGTGFYPTVRLMQACYPELKTNQGAVINFGSGAGLEGSRTQASYAAAKEAIRAVSRVAAHEWGRDGIRVNVVCPFAATPGVQRWTEAFPEAAGATVAGVPLGRIGDPLHDVAPAVVFLASDEARYITGQTLMVDGGSLMLR
jgi:NAD(P)-dependent dehydrogenase (short-subunit alcohol dehydrogenase family)